MSKKRNQGYTSKTKELEHVLVYSTDPIPEKRCNSCNQILSKCSCASSKGTTINSIKPTVRIEKKGRGGKVVTLLARLPTHETFLKELCAHLKRAVGSGGTHYIKDGEGVVEIQGEWRDELIGLAQSYVNKKEA